MICSSLNLVFLTSVSSRRRTLAQTGRVSGEHVSNDERNRREPNKCQNIARRFVAHLIARDAVPAPVATSGQIARAALRVDYDDDLVQQRGISPRPNYLPWPLATR